mgnify:CR=1 FL=1
MTQPIPITPEFRRLISGSRLRLRGKSAFFATLLLHAEFVPSREVIAAAEEAEARGLGVVSLNGKMIDGPIIDHARKVVALSASGIRD